MNDKEIEIFVLLVSYAIAYDNCNPDIGMGPSSYSIARRIASELSFPIDDKDIARVARLAENQ